MFFDKSSDLTRDDILLNAILRCSVREYRDTNRFEISCRVITDY